MFSKFKIPALAVAILLSACATSDPAQLSQSVAAQSTSSLWLKQSSSQSALELAFIEAELGVRSETKSGGAYVGRRTASAFGQPLYSRSQSISQRQPAGANLRNCSDFPSAAQAQRYFLSAGGPISDSNDLDRDGDGFACEWGTEVNRIATTSRQATRPVRPRRTTSSRCYTGPRGGTYTITSGGNRNYSGC